MRAVADVLRGPEPPAGQRDIVILWGERLTHGRGGDGAARALLNVAARLELADREGAGLIEVPVAANGRGLREAGVLPDAGPGLSELPGDTGAVHAGELPEPDAQGDLTALLLWNAETDAATLQGAGTVVVHTAFLNDALREHATVILPAESYAEKEGTVTHPDGRVQRLRPAIGRQGDVRPGWQILAELMTRAGTDPQVLTGPMASRQLFDAVPVYAGLTLEELGGHGVRWPAREQAAAWPQADAGPFGLDVPPAPVSANGDLRLGTFRSIWAGPEVDHSPALRFLTPKLRVEMAPADAQRRNVTQGDHVTVGANGTTLDATVLLRDAVPDGTVFLETDALRAGPVDVRKAPPPTTAEPAPQGAS